MTASNASTICTVLVRRGFLSKLGRVREANGKRVAPCIYTGSLSSFPLRGTLALPRWVVWFDKKRGKRARVDSKVYTWGRNNKVSTELLQRTEVTSLWLLWVFFSLSLALSYSQAGISWRLRMKYEVLVFDEVLTGTGKKKIELILQSLESKQNVQIPDFVYALPHSTYI